MDAIGLKDPAVWTTILLASAVLVIIGYVFLRSSSRGPHKLLPHEDFVAVPLIRKEVLSHDSRRFTFGLSANQTLGLKTAEHLTLKFFDHTDGGKAVQRPYTPVTDNQAVGYFSLVVKAYPPLPPKFPRGGLMSQHLENLKIGESILVKGPKGHVHWHEGGKFDVKPLGKPREERSASQFVLIAGGTGITPMLQILNAVFNHPKTSKLNRYLKFKLCYANQQEHDILVRDELENLAASFPDRFQLWYTIDRLSDAAAAASEWKYSIGFINKTMLEKHASFPVGSTQYFMCGPPPMIKLACIPALQELGYNEKDWVVM